jgi:5-methylcytosine-specific restriction endonuclease McrA
MKTTCKYCGIVDKPHHCPHSKKYRKTDNVRVDKKIYRTTKYQKVRQDVLNDYNYICLWSLYVDGEIKPADEVHHIVEILENEKLAYEYDNLIPLEYYNHHDKVHELYKKDKAKIQDLLRKMCIDYKNGDKTLGKYRECIPPTM